MNSVLAVSASPARAAITPEYQSAFWFVPSAARAASRICFASPCASGFSDTTIASARSSWTLGSLPPVSELAFS